MPTAKTAFTHRRIALPALAALAIVLPLTACLSEGEKPTPEPIRYILGNDDGVIFATGEIVRGASLQSVDIAAFKNGNSSVDLKAGVESGTTSHRPMKVFKTAGGVQETYETLDHVPHVKPTDKDNGAYAAKVKAGNAMVVTNNVSEGWTTVRVIAVASQAQTVEIEFRTF